MLNELAHFSLNIALGFAVLGTIVPLLGATLRRSSWMQLASVFATLQFLLVAFAFGVLTLAFVTSDFSLRLVVLNSHTLKPMIYKIAGVWGNHEGSLLLWVLILTFFAACAAVFGRRLPQSLLARVLGVQSAITAAFLAFVLLTSNPFTRVAFPPFNGQGLNPLLQDPGLAFHPPFLYLGYVGLSITFSFAIAALLEGKVDSAWGRWVRPWTLAAWIFLTIGIGLGSWWAYYELGWGGFWFWDPVENASFMPWLISAALLHSAIVVEKRDALKAWTILLAILAFGFSLIGTFIVRSGVLTSVHAFANDPERGVFILMILAVFFGGALLLFALRAKAMDSKGIFAPVSRESALIANNLLLAISCFVVFVGTVWPLVAELLMDRKLSVGPPFFDLAFTPFMVGLAVILPIGSTLPWKRARRAHITRLWPVALLCLAIVGLAWAIQTGRSLIGPVGLGLGVWLVMGVVIELYQRCGRGAGKARRLLRLPLADWGKAIAHAGLGITIFGVAGITAWQVEDIRVLEIGQSAEVAGFTITLEAVEDRRGPNYLTTMADIALSRQGQPIAMLHPERRYYPVAEMPTTEAGIDSGLWRDVYVVVGDAQPEGGYAVRSFIKPLANWIWTGAIIMALGGFLSLFDRRYRLAPGAARERVREAAT
ncbi:MAG: heme lyase CcmF/NrfE family subunit [Planktomarina sp.]|jgi:cytochrome c-type biogenesis protein CcmF|nr:heme lyase CcmF/NrfE family subunit [Planktomarina sp.]MDG1744873.1 heme lyase CcmF/NrfE family subunit [Planktomarina sp.]